MLDWFYTILTTLTALIVAPSISSEGSNGWRYSPEWVQRSNNVIEFSAATETIPAQCKMSPDQFVKLPVLIQGVHEVSLDGKLIAKSGDSTFRSGSAAYNSLTISCRELIDGTTFTWKVSTSTRSLAKIASSAESVGVLRFG